MISILIFLTTYIGVAIGRIPGLQLDRTGIALLGAIGMIIASVVSLDQAVKAIDFSTIILLYALMVISAQLRLGGFYTWVAFRITALMINPKLFLLVTMLVSAILSAILANDIICLAFTPVLTFSLLNASLNPIPFLLGLAISSNIGSASTIIGNPQNMLIGQTGALNFFDFLKWCIVPSLISLLMSYGLLCWFYKKKFAMESRPVNVESRKWQEFNRWQSSKGLAAIGVLIVLFFTAIPREISSLGIAGVILCSRKMKSRQMLELIDWHLITLFFALFVVIAGIEQVNLPSKIIGLLNDSGIDIRNLFFLTIISTVVSNIVSNVPATMVLIKFLDPTDPIQWYTLAVSSTFAGNLILIGSIANLIVIEQAASFGVHITFKEHAKVGIPVTLLSIVILLLWVWV